MIVFRNASYLVFLLSLAILAKSLGQCQEPHKEVIAVLKGHTDTVEAIALSLDDRVIATASFDSTAKLWDAITGRELRTLSGDQGHKGQVLAIAFSDNGQFIATGGADNFARIWESGVGFPDRAFSAMTVIAGPHAGLRFVGEFLLPADQLARRMSLAATNPLKSFQHPNLVDAVAFDPTGKLLATGCHDGKLRIWDIAKGNILKEIEAHVQKAPQQLQHPIYALAWTADAKQILTASFDKSIKLWDVTSSQLVKEFKPATEPSPLMPKKDDPKKNPDAKSEDQMKSKVEPVTKNQPIQQDKSGPHGHRDQVFTLAISKDGKHIATGSSDRTVKLWDTATGRVVRDFPNPDFKPVFPTEAAPSHPSWVHAVRFTPDGKFLVSAGSAPRNQGYLAVWNAGTGERVVSRYWEHGPIHSIAVTSDGARLIAGGAASKAQASPEVLVVKFPYP
jgi:WD40 repeat protein